MQQCIIHTKQMNAVIIAISNNLWEISYQKLHHYTFPKGYKTTISTCHSQQYIKNDLCILLLLSDKR